MSTANVIPPCTTRSLVLRGWHTQLERLLLEEPTRQVIWIFAPGCTGKTLFAKWYSKHGPKTSTYVYDLHPVMLAEALIRNSEVLLIDICRMDWDNLELVQQFADNAKECVSLTDKYNKKPWKMPHVVVFSSVKPKIFDNDHGKDYKIVHIEPAYLEDSPHYLFESQADQALKRLHVDTIHKEIEIDRRLSKPNAYMLEN